MKKIITCLTHGTIPLLILAILASFSDAFTILPICLSDIPNCLASIIISSDIFSLITSKSLSYKIYCYYLALNIRFEQIFFANALLQGHLCPMSLLSDNFIGFTWSIKVNACSYVWLKNYDRKLITVDNSFEILNVGQIYD